MSFFALKLTLKLNKHITTSISVLECPILQTMQPFFIRSSCSLVTTFLFPIKNKQRITIMYYVNRVTETEQVR